MAKLVVTLDNLPTHRAGEYSQTIEVDAHLLQLFGGISGVIRYLQHANDTLHQAGAHTRYHWHLEY